jgi:hypothetical protein
MNSHNSRNGLSVLEFLGCTMALVGGVWLGAIYLGIDLHRVAYLALAESNLMEQVPEDWRPETPESEKAPSQAELAASVHNELAALREDITSLRSAPGAEPSTNTAAIEETVPATATGKPADNAKDATLNYWQQLAQIVHKQYKLLVEAETAATEGNATKVAALKGRVSRLTATSIRAIPIKNVDRSATDFGSELANWYESGATLYDEAVQVWGTSAGGQGNPQLAKEWQQAHAQFTNEGQLLRGRATTVRDALTQQFGVEFPPLAGL